jgi:hypothetical protein
MVNVEGKHQDVNMCAWESLPGLVVRMGWMEWGISNESKNTRSFAILRIFDIDGLRLKQIWHS